MFMNSGIYKIANKLTTDFYIGSAIDFKHRVAVHKNHLKNNKHHSIILQRVYNKYGLDNLSFEIIEYIEDRNDLIFREQHYLDTLKPKYNICKMAGSNLGLKWSEKAKRKMSEAKKGENNPFYNKRHSKETRHKISENHTKCWLGKKQSEEHIAKRSEANSKIFQILSPQGKIIKGKNLYKFCKENNLNGGHMWEVINNRRKHHKGWTAVINKGDK